MNSQVIIPENVTPESLTAAGWRSISTGGFTDQAGPFWVIEEENGQRTAGLIVEDRHCNHHMGTFHGGALMTFSDIALGFGVVKALGKNSLNTATLSLQTQFVSVARVGEFVTCTPEVVRASKHVVFVRGLVKTGDKTVASVEGMWKVLEPR